MPLNLVNLSAIVVGALVALLVDLGLALFGAGVGFTLFRFEEGEGTGLGAVILGGLFALFATIVVFYLAGYVSARLANIGRSFEATLHGIASFALATFVMLFAAGLFGGSAVGGALGGGASYMEEARAKETSARLERRVQFDDESLAQLRQGAATANFTAFGYLVAGLLASMAGARKGNRSVKQANIERPFTGSDLAA